MLPYPRGGACWIEHDWNKLIKSTTKRLFLLWRSKSSTWQVCKSLKRSIKICLETLKVRLWAMLILCRFHISRYEHAVLFLFFFQVLQARLLFLKPELWRIIFNAMFCNRCISQYAGKMVTKLCARNAGNMDFSLVGGRSALNPKSVKKSCSTSEILLHK